MHHTGFNSFCVLPGGNGSEYSTSAVAIRVLTSFRNRRDRSALRKKTKSCWTTQRRATARAVRYGRALVENWANCDQASAVATTQPALATLPVHFNNAPSSVAAARKVLYHYCIICMHSCVWRALRCKFYSRERRLMDHKARAMSCCAYAFTDMQDADLWQVQKVQAMANKSPPKTPLPVAFASCRELSAIATAISAAKVAQATVALPWRSEGSSMANVHGSTQQYLSSLEGGGWATSLRIVPKHFSAPRKE